MRVRLNPERAIAWLAGVAPLGSWVWQAAHQQLGPDPAKTLSHASGQWALYWLLLSLAVTPLRRWLHWNRLLPARQVLGLLSWAYAGLHLLVYLALWIGWNGADFQADLAKRTYIIAGMAGYLLLWPLALSSHRAARRRLGRRWLKLHRLVYFIPPLAIVHVAWQAKNTLVNAGLYLLVFALLMLLRWPSRRASPATAT